MKVYVYPADVYGCGYYRLIWAALQLQKEGHDVELCLPSDRKDFTADINTETDDIIKVAVPPDADVIVMQRVTHKYLAKAIPVMRAQGVAVVIDIDDDLSALPPAHPGYASMHPKNTGDHGWHWTQYAMDHATLVTASTPALIKKYAHHGRGQVLRNCVPESYLSIPHYDSPDIGWGGALASHSNDVPVLGTSIGRLMNEGATFTVVGKPEGIKKALNLPFEPLGPEGGDVAMEQWPYEIGELGIGVAPLAWTTQFNRSKSWLKPLEYAAVGVPCVMSPGLEYLQINKVGVGLIAEKPKDWYRKLRELRTNQAMRTELAEQGREAVRPMTYENLSWLWYEAWMDAIKIQRG